MDESDKLFEDGKAGFRDQLASIFLACTSHLLRRALFSATFAHDVEEWCKLNLENVVLVSVGARLVFSAFCCVFNFLGNCLRIVSLLGFVAVASQRCFVSRKNCVGSWIFLGS